MIKRVNDQTFIYSEILRFASCTMRSINSASRRVKQSHGRQRGDKHCFLACNVCTNVCKLESRYVRCYSQLVCNCRRFISCTLRVNHLAQTRLRIVSFDNVICESSVTGCTCQHWLFTRVTVRKRIKINVSKSKKKNNKRQCKYMLVRNRNKRINWLSKQRIDARASMLSFL